MVVLRNIKMTTLTEEVRNIFDDVFQEISSNIRLMMEELWRNWSHLGVDHNTKINYITRLVLIEKDLHKELISKTRYKMKTMQAQVEKLKEETDELSKYLSADITIQEYRDDMMLVDYKKELESQIVGYREYVEQRRMKIERLLEWQRDLADKLGITIQKLNDVPLPSEEELDRFKTHLEVMQAERDKRAEIFLNVQVEIKDIMDKLQIRPKNKFEQSVVNNLSLDFKVTDLNMYRLAKLQQELQEKYEQTNNRVLELRERLIKLWECLEEDQIYRENFLHAHPGCHPQIEAAIKEEIKRCYQIKRQKIQNSDWTNGTPQQTVCPQASLNTDHALVSLDGHFTARKTKSHYGWTRRYSREGQGTFSVYERYNEIHEFVQENLEHDLPFILNTPTGYKLILEEDANKTLIDLRLVPATVLTFAWHSSVIEDINRSPNKDVYLKPEVMILVQEL